jgi:hypothetical protein
MEGNAMWELLAQEPRWLIIIGLGLDLVGGVLVAGTAWFRLEVAIPYGGPGSEAAGPLRWRRTFVAIGGTLLAVGFGLQMHGTWLQMQSVH